MTANNNDNSLSVNFNPGYFFKFKKYTVFKYIINKLIR